MVATLQKLQPPRAMRWVTRWKWITIVLVAVAVGVAIHFEHWALRFVLAADLFRGWLLGLYGL